MRSPAYALLLIPGICCVTTAATGHDFKPAMYMGDVAILPPSAKKFDDPIVSGGVNAIVNAYKLWRASARLNVCFMGGAPDVRGFFVETEREWETKANLKWDFGSGPDYRSCDPAQPSHIRVAFDHVGHWSRIGTDAINKDVINSASLNIEVAAFGDFALADKREISGTILHEIGHALGLEHEHQSPNDPCISHIRWKTIYTEMSQPPNKWDRDKVDQNMKSLVSTDRLRTTPYDKTSIMHYAFPARWFDDPNCAVGENYLLSTLDQQEIQLAYPLDPKDQGKFIASISETIKAAANDLRLSEDDKKAVQKDVASISDGLDERLRSAVTVISTGEDNKGIFFGGNVSVKTDGPCSPAVVGTQGDVTIRIDGCK